VFNGALVVTVVDVVGFVAGVVGKAGLDDVPGAIDTIGTQEVKINTIARTKASNDILFFIKSSPLLLIVYSQK
jgi:hypothetical protein